MVNPKHFFVLLIFGENRRKAYSKFNSIESNSFGVNISDVFTGITGVNEVTRSNALAIQKTGINSVLNHFSFWNDNENLGDYGLNHFSEENPYPLI